MDFLEIILNRRSIRRYKPIRVENSKIKTLLRCAMYAPSAVNKQPWHFIVIDDRSVMKRIMEMHPSSKMLETASHAILVCGDEKLQHDVGYWIADCGAATENILLAEKSMDLGTCWIGIYPRELRMRACKEIFGLPPHIQAFCLIAVGYPDEKKDMPERFKPERIFHNFWNNPF